MRPDRRDDSAGLWKPGEWFSANPIPAYQPDHIRTNYTLDLSKAKQLLADAGWADADGDEFVERSGKKFSFECEYPCGLAQFEQQLPYMQEAWKEIGIEMIPVLVPFPTLGEHVTSSNYDMSIIAFSLKIDPDQSWIFLLRADRIQPHAALLGRDM